MEVNTNGSHAAEGEEHILHCPPFEGSEKRIEVDFSWANGSGNAAGLRDLTRRQLDELMEDAACTIVSSRSNAQFDAYVLSESSLFVYPTKYVLKTCGTTKLLASVPRLLTFVAEIGMEVQRVKYSRATFLFPDQQHFPHTSFDDEVQFLDEEFASSFTTPGKSHVLGEPFEGLQWHVYVNAKDSSPAPRPTYNLELCLTELGLEEALQFVRTEAFVSAAQTTADSGIKLLKPKADIDDYVFEPCGYSMNGIEGTGLITIHITPEPGHSYASVELSGYAEDVSEGPDHLLETALRIFRPGRVSLALTSSAGAAPVLHPSNFKGVNLACLSNVTQDLAYGGSVSFYNLVAQKEGGEPQSPTSTLHHNSSWLSNCNSATGRSSPPCAFDERAPSVCASINNDEQVLGDL